jgi:hypothetical protein
MMRRIVRGLRRRLAAVVRFCLRPCYRLVHHHFHCEIDLLRHEVAALRQEITILRTASLQTHATFLQQLTDEFVRLQTRLEGLKDQSRAA